MLPNVSLLSLFCGCGGLDLGFLNAGFDVVLALDVDPVGVTTYNHNRGDEIAQIMDLRETDGREIMAVLRTERPGLSISGVVGGVLRVNPSLTATFTTGGRIPGGPRQDSTPASSES